MAEVLVEFIPDFSKLESSLDELVSKGVITKDIADAFKKAQQPIDALSRKIKSASQQQGRDLGQLSGKVKQVAKDMQDGFREGAMKALDDAGVSVQEFKQKLDQLLPQQKTLKQELRETVLAMQQLKKEGKDNSAQYAELRARAGELKDTIADVNDEVSRTASDTEKLDTVINGVQGVAAGFQIAAGAAALFGDENEDITQALVQLNAIMAITNGLQQIQNLLLKESNLVRFVTNTQLKLQTVATNLQTAAQSKNVVVSAAATAGMKILNAVMTANPAFILVGAFTLLAGALLLFTNRAKASADETERLNRVLANTQGEVDRRVKAVQDAADKEDAILEAGDAKESERTKRRIANRKKENVVLLAVTNQQQAEFDRVQADIDAGRLKRTDELIESQNKLGEAITDNANKFRANNKQNELDSIRLTKVIRDEATKQKEDADKAAKDASDRQKKADEERREQILAGIRRQLLDAEKGSDEELKLRKQLVIKEALFQIQSDELVGDRKKEVLRTAQLELEKLDKEFANDRKNKAIENEISILNAQLSVLELSASERERLTVEQLEKQRQLELSAVLNNKTKEAEINAKFDKEIAEQRLAIRQAGFDKELELATVQGAAATRALQAITQDDTAGLERRLAASDQLLDNDLENIEKRRDFQDQALAENLISQEDYNLAIAKLDDETAIAHERAEKFKTDTTKSESAKRIETFKKEAQQVIDAASAVAGVLENIFSIIAENQNARFEQQKAEVANLRELNAITEKEAAARIRIIERAEREAKRKQAQREKALAIFQAVINGASAVIEAAPNPFLIALTAALVASQIAAIIARPIPQFGKGVKRAPKGLAEVGETGTELIQTERGYYIADYPQVVWMKGGERVYNPQETNQIFNNIVPQGRETLDDVPRETNGKFHIDYDRLSKSIGNEISKHPRNVISFDEEGFAYFHMNKANKTKYLNKRYTFHD